MGNSVTPAVHNENSKITTAANYSIKNLKPLKVTPKHNQMPNFLYGDVNVMGEDRD